MYYIDCCCVSGHHATRLIVPTSAFPTTWRYKWRKVE